jgi:hypothetical protein
MTEMDIIGIGTISIMAIGAIGDIDNKFASV